MHTCTQQEEKLAMPGIDLDEMLELARLLSEEDGVDFIDISAWEALKRPEKYKSNPKKLITYFKEKLNTEKTRIMVAGKIWTRQDAESCLDAGADFVLLGKAAIGMPEWPSWAQKNDGTPPRKPPYTDEQLKHADLGPAMIEYMKGPIWQGFVKNK
jgi:2,4-dienoyl-CoA reductase-like NADH-dependent reductase (Old Yellow Enzyme family)